MFVLDNDVNVVVLGECWKGVGENNFDVIFIILGIGVGGGIVVVGELFYGVVGCVGEVGYVMVDFNGFDCICGKCGCLEIVFSVIGVVCVVCYLLEEFVGDFELK